MVSLPLLRESATYAENGESRRRLHLTTSTNFSPPIATPVNAITIGEVPISIPAGTIGDSLPIASTSTQPLDSVDADGSVMQAPPSKKRRVRE